MKRTILPRTGALMLALAVVFGLLPMGALAATDYTQYSTEEFESQYTYAGEIWARCGQRMPPPSVSGRLPPPQ